MQRWIFLVTALAALASSIRAAQPAAQTVFHVKWTVAIAGVTDAKTAQEMREWIDRHQSEMVQDLDKRIPFWKYQGAQPGELSQLELSIQIESDNPKASVPVKVTVNSAGISKELINETLFGAGELQPDVEGADRILERVARQFQKVFENRLEQVRDRLRWVRVADGFHQPPSGDISVLPVPFARIRAYRYSSFEVRYQDTAVPQVKLGGKGIGPITLAGESQRYWAVQLAQAWNQGWKIHGVYLQQIDDTAADIPDDVDVPH